MTQQLTAQARALGLVAAAAALTAACGGERTVHLDPRAFAMTENTAAFYEDGETTLYQVQAPVTVPVVPPTEGERAGLRGRIGPFDHRPWVTTEDVRVQLTWTVANLDPDDHVVKVLVDPWNEFGRYVPGFSGEGDEAVPNLSGFEDKYALPGTRSDRSSRIHRTLTYADMDELAADFATAINIIETVQPPPPDEGEGDPRVGYVNHTFAVENRQGDSVLTDRYRPAVIPALLGFDLGLRTEEPANIVLEYAIEVVDRQGERIPEDVVEACIPPRQPGIDTRQCDPLLEAPDREYTIGN